MIVYTIGQISKMFNLPISTLRYYDAESLFPNMQKISGIRQFSEREIERLRIIECLKRSGLEIKDIKQFMEWSTQGNKTYEQRKQLFENQKQVVQAEMKKLEKVMDMLEYKCWYYSKAIEDGCEDEIYEMLPDHLPQDIQKHYDNAHRDE